MLSFHFFKNRLSFGRRHRTHLAVGAIKKESRRQSLAHRVGNVAMRAKVNRSEGLPSSRRREKVGANGPPHLRPWSPFLLRVVVREGLDGDD